MAQVRWIAANQEMIRTQLALIRTAASLLLLMLSTAEAHNHTITAKKPKHLTRHSPLIPTLSHTQNYYQNTCKEKKTQKTGEQKRKQKNRGKKGRSEQNIWISNYQSSYILFIIQTILKNNHLRTSQTHFIAARKVSYTFNFISSFCPRLASSSC